jgi:hypothetical protein
MLDEHPHQRSHTLIGHERDLHPREYFKREVEKCTFVSAPS